MELEEVLHMNGGEGETSYAQNSLLQQRAIPMTKPIIEKAIHKIHNSFPTARCIAIADLGCSSGPNALLAIRELTTSIHKARRELENHSPVCILAFLNDLPRNDFNSVFKELPSFNKQLKQEIGECFVYGAPGSFYGRLFEPQSLHFVHSSFCLHWLSQIPKEVAGRSKKSISAMTSVNEAYYKQFQTDFAAFLRCRSVELVTGGCIVFTLAGRSDNPSIKRSDYCLELLLLTLTQMVSEYEKIMKFIATAKSEGATILCGGSRPEGLIEEETLDMFNIPIYCPSPTEIENEVKKEGSFRINQLQEWELEWGVAAPNATIDDEDKVRRITLMVRAVVESLLAQHFDQGLMEEIFRRYMQVLRDCMAKERCFLTNITVSLTKKI